MPLLGTAWQRELFRNTCVTQTLAFLRHRCGCTPTAARDVSYLETRVTQTLEFLRHRCLHPANFAVPLLGTWLAGGASVAMFYLYLLGFDLLNIIGHCNFELFPAWPFVNIPGDARAHTPACPTRMHRGHSWQSVCMDIGVYTCVHAHEYAYALADTESTGGGRENDFRFLTCSPSIPSPCCACMRACVHACTYACVKCIHTRTHTHTHQCMSVCSNAYENTQDSST